MLTTRHKPATKLRRTGTIAALALLGMGGARAATVQSLATLEQTAVQAVRDAAPTGARVVAHAGTLDPRLRLPACSQPPLAHAPSLGRAPSRLSIAVSCPTGPGWTVRVPVQVEIYRKVAVADHALTRGDAIAPGDIQLEERNVVRLGYGYIVNPSQLVGRSVRRSVTRGTAITPAMLKPRELVHRGQPVSVIATVGQVEVRTTGVALATGKLGAVIRVRSDGCHCVVQGKVQSDGTIAALP
jgi:flagella basal body P-ring formation protein FlgA